MKDPLIELKGDGGTFLAIRLWLLINELIYDCAIQISEDCELKLYLNGEEVEKSPEMEEEQ